MHLSLCTIAFFVAGAIANPAGQGLHMRSYAPPAKRIHASAINPAEVPHKKLDMLMTNAQRMARGLPPKRPVRRAGECFITVEDEDFY